MTQISNEQIRLELEKVCMEVAKLTQQQTMSYVRPPRGIFNNKVLSVSEKYGYTNVFWSIAYRDRETNKQKGWNYVYTNVIDQLHPGAVILLHTVSRDNTLALDKIIDGARERGFQPQISFAYSLYMALYDLIVPKDNMLRQINELVDFSFVYDELKANYCLDNDAMP